MTSPADLSIAAARAEIAVGHLDPVELLEGVLARVAARDGELNAYLHVDGDAALAAARVAPPGPLRGIPVCVKDVIDVAGMPTTAGTAEWRRTPSGDAPAVARLRAAGAVVVGKGHTNELAYGIDGRNPHHGDCRNPRHPDRLTGGSTSGPTAAVVAVLHAYFRDVQPILAAALLPWFFLTPIFFRISDLPGIHGHAWAEALREELSAL